MEAKRKEVKLTAQAEQLARELASQAGTIDELNGLLGGLMKSALQRMLDTEMDVHLGRKDLSALPEPPALAQTPETPPNRRNGYSQKTVQGELGEVRLDIPRDRLGTFEPQLIGKYQRRLAGFDDKVLALYAKGLTTRDIQDVVQELYGVEVSATLISQITADLDGEVSIWRSRRLEPVWPIVYFDGIVVHVRGESGQVSQHTMYVALGINLQGRKELLGLWLAQSEGAKFWLSCLTDLKNRGLSDIFVACVDGLSGFPEAIRAAYPQTKVQLCVVHLVRAALKYVNDKDSREVIKDLQAIYRAATADEAKGALDRFAEKWDSKYPTIGKQWRLRWAEIVAMFEFPPEIRKAIYTTNAIESVNSAIRKFTRNRKQYPSADSAVKLIYLAINEASRKWTMPIKGWKQALNHFAILFEGRLPLNLTK
jgi:transposase-like protein